MSVFSWKFVFNGTKEVSRPTLLRHSFLVVTSIWQDKHLQGLSAWKYQTWKPFAHEFHTNYCVPFEKRSTAPSENSHQRIICKQNWREKKCLYCGLSQISIIIQVKLFGSGVDRKKMCAWKLDDEITGEVNMVNSEQNLHKIRDNCFFSGFCWLKMKVKFQCNHYRYFVRYASWMVRTCFSVHFFTTEKAIYSDHNPNL